MFFEKFTNYSKTHRRRKVIPLLYAEKRAAFTVISRKIFHFSLLCLPSGKRSSYYTQKKQAFCVGVFQNVYKKFKNTPSPETVPTIRIKDKRFGKVLFGKKRKASHLFPLRRAICTPSLFFPDEVQIDLLLYAQKAGVLIAHFSKLFFLFRWNVRSILKGKCSKRKRTTSIFEHSVRIEWFVKSMQSCPRKRTCYVWTIETICDTMIMLIESNARPVIHGGIYG